MVRSCATRATSPKHGSQPDTQSVSCSGGALVARENQGGVPAPPMPPHLPPLSCSGTNWLAVGWRGWRDFEGVLPKRMLC